MILVFGTICLDRVRRIDAFPPPGGYAEVRDERVLLGGEAANTASCLCAWGAPVVLCGNPLGAGPEGRRLRSLLEARGFLLEADLGETRTPICDVYVTSEGGRTMFGSGFADMDQMIDPERVPYVAGGWFSPDPNFEATSRAAARKAAEAGMRLYLMDFVREAEPITPGAFWQSSTDWAGRAGDPEANIGWVESWVARHGCFTVLTDGPCGLTFGGPGVLPRHYPAFPVPEAVDATGAGDAFRAGMLLGLENSWPIEDTLRFASAAGALACGAMGASERIPDQDEVLKLVRACPEIAAEFDAI